MTKTRKYLSLLFGNLTDNSNLSDSMVIIINTEWLNYKAFNYVLALFYIHITDTDT